MFVESGIKASVQKKIDSLITKVGKKEKVDKEVVINIINEIFNPNGVFDDTLIPLSFLTSETGAVFISALENSGLNERLSISEICENSGFTRQWIHSEIKRGNLKAKMEGKIWFVRKQDYEEYIEKKNKEK